MLETSSSTSARTESSNKLPSTISAPDSAKEPTLSKLSVTPLTLIPAAREFRAAERPMCPDISVIKSIVLKYSWVSKISSVQVNTI